MLVKVNTVMISGINDHHLPAVAKRVHELGAFMINIIPLIPVKGTSFAHLRPPTLAERRAVQDACEVYIQVMRHCRQCRADAVGLLGQDRSPEFSKERVAALDPVSSDGQIRKQTRQKANELIAARRQLRVNIACQTALLDDAVRMAVCTKGGGMVNLHFGHAQEFLVYQLDRRGIHFLEARRTDRYCTGPEDCGNAERMDQIIHMLEDCQVVLANRFGLGPEYELRAAGIEPVIACDLIEQALADALTLLQGGN
jgi:nitrogen fixation protein NifB